jgi:ribosomal protein L7/L12
LKWSKVFWNPARVRGIFRRFLYINTKGNLMDAEQEERALLWKRVALLERQVKFLLGQTSVPFVDYGDTNFPEVAALKGQGKMMDAIKLYRSITNAGLVEAKAFVESL